MVASSPRSSTVDSREASNPLQYHQRSDRFANEQDQRFLTHLNLLVGGSRCFLRLTAVTLKSTQRRMLTTKMAMKGLCKPWSSNIGRMAKHPPAHLLTFPPAHLSTYPSFNLTACPPGKLGDVTSASLKLQPDICPKHQANS